MPDDTMTVLTASKGKKAGGGDASCRNTGMLTLGWLSLLRLLCRWKKTRAFAMRAVARAEGGEVCSPTLRLLLEEHCDVHVGDRYRSLQISQVFLKSSPDVALLFDEVEDVYEFFQIL